MTHLALPAKARTYVYAIIGALSLAVGATQVGYASLSATNPDWLTVALAVVPFLAAGLGYTAATHTPAQDSIIEPGEGDTIHVEQQSDSIRGIMRHGRIQGDRDHDDNMRA